MPVQETNVGAVTRQVTAGVGGVILFGDQAPDDLDDSLRALVAHAPRNVPPLIMTDEEGGAVERMANLVGHMPSARRMGATMTPREIRRLARRVGARMSAAGVTMNLAPVLDLDGRPGPSNANPDGTRSFGPQKKEATADGLAFARGMRDGGVIPVVKHFPGLGGATSNPDVGPASTRPWSRIKDHDLYPFAAAVDDGIPAVMVADADVPGLTARPAALSRAVVHRVLRERLGFRRLVMTDSLSAGAISAAGYTVARASARALIAGADMVLYNAVEDRAGSVLRNIVKAITRSVRNGSLPRQRLRKAVLHVLHIKRVSLCAH